MAYATSAELAVLMGRGDTPFTPTEEAKAELLLTLATGRMDGELGQSLVLAETTAEIDGTGTPVLLLPRWPVTAVEQVTVIEDLDEPAETLVANIDYRWSRHGRLRRLRRCWPCIERAVEVIFTAGLDPIPDELKGMNLRLAQGGWDNFVGLESERLGDWSAKWATVGMNFTTDDLATLSRYRVQP
jgi:hypothetical protein